jgi:two-component system OmpR family response regulator
MKVNGLLPEGEPAGAAVHGRAKPRHRILIVDDDDDIRLMYANALDRPSCHVDTAVDGASGWAAIQTHHYNLLITEYNLPGLTGLELVRKLRAARMALPVVMTAVRLPVQELGLDPSLQLVAVLPKPFYISQLLETVRTVLRATDSPHEQIDPLPNQCSQPSAVGLWLK